MGRNPAHRLHALLPWCLAALACVAAWWLVDAWTARNGLMDGHQNEFLHVGNALDLWEALAEGDPWRVRLLLLTNYWPPGFYLWPLPWAALLGATHRAMVLANVGHLAVLLAALVVLARDLGGPRAALWAVGFLLVCPSITGNLVRYEPSVAVTAWVTVAALALMRSRRFRDPGWSAAFGLACGVGSMMDRVNLPVFLLLPTLVEAAGALASDRRALRVRNLAMAAAGFALLAGAWHASFLRLHLEELLSQGAVGEIDSAGHWSEQRDPLSLAAWLFYPATFLDSQAGMVPGLVAVLALGASALRGDPRARVPWRVILGSVALFTFVQKKQVYYTIPMLGCLAALVGVEFARRPRLGWSAGLLALLFGVHQVGLQMWDRPLPLLPVAAGQPWLPEGLVAPRFPQALPPRDLDLPIDELVAALPDGDVVVYSEDPTWYEGYLVLQIRERAPGRRVRGLLVDPRGTYEWFRTVGSFVHVDLPPWERWPRRRAMERRLVENHYRLDDLPPIADVIAESRSRFGDVAAWPVPTGSILRLHRNRWVR